MNRTEPHAIAQTASRHTLLRYARVWLIASLVVLGGAAWADPPGRVGAVSLVDGEAWMSDPTSSESFAPSINWPVSTGTTVETGMTSRIELRIGSSVVRLDGDTKLRFDRLDDAAIRMRLDHGTISVRHRNLDNALETTVVTAGGTVSFVETGRYRIDATDNGVSIAVMQGAARWDSPRASYGARTGLRMDIGYDGYARSTDIATDGFDDWVASRDRRDDRLAAPRYVSPEMTGYDTLDQDGVWQTTADYGPVWYPRVVVAGWAPYRYGRWVNYGAWGWTWVDDAPWGFAVSHYGRWAWLDGRWGWVPGAIVPRPVWAPALVAWAGGSNWSFSVSLGAPAVGWVPLAPSEVFVPYYAASPRYCQVVNVAQVTNVRVINNYYQNPGSQAYANAQVPGAVSAAAAGAAVARGAVSPTPQQVRLIRAVNDPRIAQQAFEQHRILAPAVNNPVRIAVTAPPVTAAGVAAAAAGNRFAAVNGRPLPAATWRAVEQTPARQMPLPAYRSGLPPAAQAAAPRGPEGPAPSNTQRVMPAPQGNPAFNGARPEQHYPNVPERAYTPQQRIAPPAEVQRGYAPPMPAPQERGNFAPQRAAPPMPAQQERGYAPPQRMAQQPLPPTPQRAAAPPERQFNRQAPRPEQHAAPHGGEKPRGEPHPRNEPQRLNER